MNSKPRTLLVALALVASLLQAQAAFGRVDGGGGSGPSAGSRIVPGKWVVALDAPIDASTRRSLRAAGVRVERVSRDRLRAVVASATPQADAMRRLDGLGAVEWVEPVSIHRAALVPTDPSYAMQWGLGDISAEQAWDTTTGAPSVTIGVVDSGIDLTHPEFAGRIAEADDYDFANDDAVPQDDNGHGTHVAGIAAAAMNNGVGGTGVAPKCTILPVKVLSSSGEGYNFDIAEGIRWAASHGADVINISIEGGYSTDIANAVAEAQAADVVVVAAVGNSAGSVAYPARLPGVVGVSAVDSAWQLASFSNRGAGVDIAAPGVTIWSTWTGGSMKHQDGTSMASPFVAGVAALMRCVNPALSQEQVTSRLMASASDIGAPSIDTSYGAGLLHASRAVSYAVAVTDDDIPGVNIPASPVAGTLHSTEDTHDVYAVSLVAGEGLTATLTAGPGTAFDLHAYEPNAQHVTGGDTPLESSVETGYPKTVTFVASDTGIYYLDVAAVSGAGEYALEFSRMPNDPADNEIPGVELPASPFQGTLVEVAGIDRHDVFRVDLESGYQLNVGLTADPGTDFDLYLFLPEATTVANNISAVALAIETSYPEQMMYTTKRAGTYYLDVHAYSGSSPYTLTWSVVKTTPQADDDIPGVALPASPATGQLAAGYDPDDVYHLDLDAGQEVTATLSGTAGADFDLHLYGPDALHVVPPDEPLESSEQEAVSSEIVTYTAQAAGRYYLDVRALSGSGSYTLSWQRGTGPADGSLPGVALPASPVSRLLGVASDPDDVFAVHLAEGQQLNVSVEPSAGLDADLYLYGPDATALASDTAAASYWHGAAERVTYIAPQAGTYQVDVRARSGSGLYSLTHAVGSATASVTTLSLAAEQPVGDRSVTLTATLTADGGAPVVGRTLVFESESGGAWAAVATSTTGADGAATVTVSSSAVRFRARHSGDAQTAAATAVPTSIASRAESVARLSASTTVPVYLGAVTLTAHVSEAGTSTLIAGPITIERFTGSEWVPVPTSAISTGTANATVKLTSAATYRVVFGGTASYHPSVSSSVLVKPRAAVSNPVAPLTMYRSRYYTVYGSLRPRHTAGTYPVRIYRYRYSSGRWVSYGYVLAKAYNYSTFTKYARSIRLPYTGTWRLRAYAPADAGHSAAWSAGYDTVRVR